MGYVVATLLAVLFGATVAVAPVLLALPIFVTLGMVLLYFAVRSSRRSIGVMEESWPVHALFILWVIVINIPNFIAFDESGFTKDHGLFNPQSIARILIFLAATVATVIFWFKWGRSPMRKMTSGIPQGAKLVFAFYGWYLLTAPLVITGTSLVLSAFRSLEWIVAVGLLVLLFAVQNAQGKHSLPDRLKLVTPMLFFLLLSNIVALPLFPGMIYSVSAVTGAGRFGGLFTHPNLLALVCVLLCAYALAFLYGWKRTVLALVSVVALVLTYSRGGFAAFAAMVAFALWFLIPGIPARLALVGFGFVSAIVLVQIPEVEDNVLGFLARGGKTETLGTLSERTAVWEASKILIERSPWLGSGFISGPKTLADVMIEKRLSTNFAAPHAHNEFLQAQISGGPVGMLLSVFLQLRIALLLFRGGGLQPKEHFFAWSVFCGCVMWGFLQPSLSYLLYLPGMLLIWLLLTLEGLEKSPIARDKTSHSHGSQWSPVVTIKTAKHLGLCAVVLGSGLFFLPTSTFAAGAFSESSYVTVKGGHLERDGQRLRVWGVNLQSGVFKTYTEIDELISRLDTLGFNAVRLWPTTGTFYRISTGAPPTFSISVRGDSSDLDRFDYFVATASRKGINLQMPMLHYLDLPMLKSSQESAIVEMVRASTDDSMLRRVHGFAPYVSQGYRNRLKLHMHRLLARKNPYTGRRYADEPAVSSWELANEAIFVHCAIDPVCLRRLPAIAIAYLDTAWRNSPNNPDKSALPKQLEAIVEPGFYAGYSRFVVEQFLTVSNEMRDFARTIGGEGSGVSSQPFIFNTNPGERAAITQYAYGSGDVFSTSAYSSPLSSEKGYHQTAWLPFVAGGKPIPFLEYVKIKDKPFIVYEGSFFRPYDFRAEWGIVMAAIGLKQDWDGAFLYSFGQPSVIYDTQGGKVIYGNKELPNPVPGDKGERGHYAYSFHHGGDPVTMASWSVGGRLFLSAPPEQYGPDIIWDVPLEQVFKPGAGYPAAFLKPENLTVLPRTTSMATQFVDTSPLCSPCKTTKPVSKEVIVEWNNTAKRLSVRTPGGRAVVGELAGDLGDFFGGIKVRIVSPGFGAVAVTDDSINQRTHLQVIGGIENTGIRFDQSRVDYHSPEGAMYGMLHRGGSPLVYVGPDVRFLLSATQQEYEEIDFGLHPTAKRGINREYDYTSSSRIFQVDLTKNVR